MMESGLSAIGACILIPPRLTTAGCDLAYARSTAYVLNLRGDDVPYNPVFHAYLYIGLDKTILFVDSNKLRRDVRPLFPTLLPSRGDKC